MQGAFLNALLYRPPSITGKQLLPFSCWHGLVLEEMDSSFIVGGELTIEEAIVVIEVCSKRRDEFILDKNALVKAGKKIKPDSYSQIISDVKEYIEKSFFLPVCWKEEKEKSLKIPIWFHLVYFAMKHLHYSEEEAWNANFARLFCYMLCESEINNTTEVMSDDEIMYIRRAEEIIN